MRLLIGVAITLIASPFFTHFALAQDDVWYYCDASHAYYPYVQTCRTQWRTVAPNADAYGQSVPSGNDVATSPPAPLQSTQQGATTRPASFALGLADRESYETWFASLSGDYLAGATYWAAHRSLKNHGTCDNAGTSNSTQWISGCTAAQERLAPYDTLRHSDRDFRQGWNSWKPTTDQSAQQIRQPSTGAAVTDTQPQVLDAAEMQQRAIAKAETRGYENIASVKDLILDGKDLANRNAKIQVVGIYRKMGGTSVLYASILDSYQNNDNYIPILTDDAQRALREYLLNFLCESNSGCQIDVGGHMTMCEPTNLLLAGTSMPCLDVEVEIVYRPGD